MTVAGRQGSVAGVWTRQGEPGSRCIGQLAGPGTTTAASPPPHSALPPPGLTLRKLPAFANPNYWELHPIIQTIFTNLISSSLLSEGDIAWEGGFRPTVQ